MLAFQQSPSGADFAAAEILSPFGDLREAAANMFAAMHRLDAMNLDFILAERVPDRGLGLAINDRLQRAAHAKTEERT
jgi:L-threonylcarbamoyladenylate synthase